MLGRATSELGLDLVAVELAGFRHALLSMTFMQLHRPYGRGPNLSNVEFST
jgi:hypothetical protein